MNIKKKFGSNWGLSLTELLVASVMIGIVMVGVASFGVAIRELQSSTNNAVIISMRAKAVMARIANDAYLAVGNPLDVGIDTTDVAAGQSICFRRDVNNTPAPPPIPPYADDEWICYFRNDADDQLYLCGAPTPPGNVPVASMASCGAGGPARGLIDIDPALGSFFNIVNDGAGRMQYVEITLAAVFDSAAAIHPVENPVYTVTSQISPPGHSR